MAGLGTLFILIMGLAACSPLPPSSATAPRSSRGSRRGRCTIEAAERRAGSTERWPGCGRC
jgi:hypothetical protein